MFDDLPGKGRRLDLTRNPYAQDEELAFKVLKDAGYAPEWIELDKAIRSRSAAACSALQRSRRAREASLGELEDRSDSWTRSRREQIVAAWEKAVATFSEEIGAINDGIAILNLKVPSPRFQRHKLDPEREVERMEGEQG